MARIQVQAGQSMLEGYVRKPGPGLCELIWNAFDEDATLVKISRQLNDLGGLEGIVVEDNGNGMTVERAARSYATVGDSWKRMPGTLSSGGRPVHGRHGRGRYAAFGLGDIVRWQSTSDLGDGSLGGVEIVGNRSDLQYMEVSSIKPSTSRGTRVTIGLVTSEAKLAFDNPVMLRNKMLIEFALHLERFREFNVEFLDERLEPDEVIEAKESLAVPLAEQEDNAATLTVIEWKLTDVERRLYLCDAAGSIVDELPPKVNAPGAEFTAYLQWRGFTAGLPVALDDDTQSPNGQAIHAARDVLRDYLNRGLHRREAEAVRRWKSEGVYPYSDGPRDAVEHAARDVFNVVAMAASRTLDETSSRGVKALSLSLLRETLESNPEALLPILHKVTKLPAARIEELRELLERTSLSQLIQSGKEIGNRVEFLSGLDSILFDRSIKKRLLERRQLHRILAHETWIFGEEWNLTGDDEPLDRVLRKHLARLGKDVEIATERPAGTGDGATLIPDLVLGRTLETGEDRIAHLVVELKRPSHKLSDTDVVQLRKYASAIVNDERFSQPNVRWEFWLVGNSTTTELDEMREQTNLPHGVVQNSTKYRIITKTWAEVTGDAKHRLKFVQRSLQYESSRDSGLAYLRSKYAAYLPAEATLGES